VFSCDTLTDETCAQVYRRCCIHINKRQFLIPYLHVADVIFLSKKYVINAGANVQKSSLNTYMSTRHLPSTDKIASYN